MTYWEMDDAFIGHHKTRRAVRSGWEALGMWLALRTYVALHLTDGFIPDEEIDELPSAPKAPRKWLKVLVECGRPERDGTRGPGLLDPVDGGWMLHDYGDHALSADEIRRRRDYARDRKCKQRQRDKGGVVTRPVTRDMPEQSHNPSRVTAAIPSHPIRDQILPDTHTPRPDRSEPDEAPPETCVGVRRFAESFESECPKTVEYTDKNRTRTQRCGGDIDELYEQFRAKRIREKARYCNEASVCDDFDAWLLAYAKNREEKQRNSVPRVNEMPGKHRSRASPDVPLDPFVDIPPEAKELERRRKLVEEGKRQVANGTYRTV